MLSVTTHSPFEVPKESAVGPLATLTPGEVPETLEMVPSTK
jgi:hypothetical protein